MRQVLVAIRVLGVSNVLKIFSEEVRNIPYQRGVIFTPITLKEINLLIENVESKIFVPSWIRAKLLDETVEILYLDDWIDEIQQRANQKEKVSKTQIWESLLETIDSANFMPNLKKQSFIMGYVLLYSIMSKFQMEELKIKLHNTGNTPGMMTEGRFWSDS